MWPVRQLFEAAHAGVCFEKLHLLLFILTGHTVVDKIVKILQREDHPGAQREYSSQNRKSLLSEKEGTMAGPMRMSAHLVTFTC